MFAQSLYKGRDSERVFAGNSSYGISDVGYGKDAVKLLHVQRNGPVHTIKEFEVGTHLKLYSQKDYFKGIRYDFALPTKIRHSPLLEKIFPYEKGSSISIVKDNNMYKGESPQGNTYTIAESSYGKDAVKMLHVLRKGPVHTIKEFEVATHLKLTTSKDYLKGDNSDIVATDSQKNTVYLLAKKHGVENPEKFAMLLCKHFLNKYSHVKEVHIHVEEYPWQRISQSDNTNTDGKKHNHAFVFTPTALRYCDVISKRSEPIPTVISGIKGLRVLKTTQSSFVNFVNDEFRSLPDQYDRIFSTVVDCSWEYSKVENVMFCRVWDTVKDIIIKNFAGDPHVGVTSPSVQHTLFLSEKEVLDIVPQVSAISMTMPNKHYFNFDTKPFQGVVPGDNNEVFIPVDKPHGTIYAQLERKDLQSKL